MGAAHPRRCPVIKATLYLEMGAEQVKEPAVLPICQRAFEIEAEKRGYMLDGEMQIEPSDKPGQVLLVWPVKDRS